MSVLNAPSVDAATAPPGSQGANVATPETPAQIAAARTLDANGNPRVQGSFSTDQSTGLETFNPTSTKATEPTVLSSGNITDNVIPKNNATLAGLADKGTYSANGQTYNADGSPATPTDTTTTGSPSSTTGTDTTQDDPAHQQIVDLISSLKGNLDSSTKASIDSIEQSYMNLKQQQETINTQAAGARTAALLTGGTSRYSPDTASGIMQTQLSYGLQQIAKLDADENSAIAAAKTAQQNGDMQLADKLITEAQNVRTNKQTVATQLNAALSKQTSAALTAKNQSNIDTSISKLYADGTTDPAAILKTLTDAGMDVTAKDVAAAIKNLVPTSSTTDTLKFSSSQLGKLYGAGLSTNQVQALSDYYNGKDGASSDALNGLTADQQGIVHDALNGLSTKPTTTTGGTTKPYVSGKLTYTSDILGKIGTKLKTSEGVDHYVDPAVYQNAFDAWTNSGGLAKDFIKNFPPKTYVNPANTWLPAYLESKTKASASTSASGRSA